MNYTIDPVDYTPEDEDYGPVSPMMPQPMREKDPSMSYMNALSVGSLPYRLAQRATQEFYDTEEVEEGYDPFEQWKDFGSDDSLLYDFMQTRNTGELVDLTLRLNEERDRRSAIEQYGFIGEAGDFLFNVATDPTTYMGFGAGMMLKGGMGAAKAFAISGGAAGATMSGLEEMASPERMTMQEAGVNIAAATVFSGFLGGAVESLAKLNSKGLVSNFEDMSLNAFNDASGIEQRANRLGVSDAKGIGADVVVPDLATYNSTVAGGKVVRAITKGLGQVMQSPRLLAQTMESKEVRDIVSTGFYGTNIKTQSNVEGVSGSRHTFSEEIDTIRQQDVGWIAREINDDVIIKKFGGALEESDKEIIARALYGEPMVVDNLTPKQRYVYEKTDSFYKDKADVFESVGVADFSRRSDYGMPAQFSLEKISANVSKFETRIYDSLVQARQSAEDVVDSLRSKLDEARAKLDETPDPRYRDPLRARVQSLEDLMDRYSMVARSSDQELLDEATSAALDYSTGNFGRSGMLPPGVSIGKSGFFNERIIDPLKFMDFLDVDPINLARRYSDSTAPHLAIKKAFPKYNGIEDILENAFNEARDKAVNYSNPDKVFKEITKAKELMRRSWDQETGLEIARKAGELGGAAPYIQSLDSAAYLTQMGGQTLAALTEPTNGMIFHGLKYGTELLGALRKMAKDPLVRDITREEASYFGVGLEVHMADHRLSMVGNEIAEKELASAVSKGLRKGALWMSKANLSVYFDSMTRKAALVAQQGIFKENIKKYAQLDKDIKGDLAFLGIDSKNIDAISAQLDKYGKDTRGIFVSNVSKWDDLAAKEAWIGAIRKDQRRMTAQADLGDVAHFYRTPIGRLMMKYKTWATVATQKLFIGGVLQGGSKAMPGIATAVSAGAMVNYLMELSKGNEPSTDPEELLYGGIVRSGLAGLLPDVGGSYLLNRLAGVESGGAKYYSYMDMQDLAAGPVGGLLGDVGKVVGAPLPVYSDGEYRMGWETKGGNTSRGTVNSIIDVMPIPLVKPWIKSYSNEIIE